MADWAQSQLGNRPIITNAPSGGSDCIAVDLFKIGLTVTTSSTWVTANTAVYLPFVVYQPLTVVKMAVINGTVVSGNIDVGIYDTGQHRLVSKGSTAQAGTSAIQSFDITDTLLQPGEYYAAVAMDNTTGTLSQYQTSVTLAGAAGCLSQATAFALPDPATFAAATSKIPVVMLTTRTLV